MAKMGPILLGLGAAALLLRSKKGGGTVAPSPGGFGGSDPGGTSECHVLPGFWAPSMPAAESQLSEITSNPNLAILPLTPDGFLALDAAFQKFFELNPTFIADNPDPEAAADGAAHWACRDVTNSQGLNCPWAQKSQWTPRMNQVYGAARLMFKEGTKPGGFLAPFMGG